MVNPKQVANYFAQVLRRGRLEEVTFKDATFVSTTRDQLATGSLTPQDADTLFAAHDEAKAASRSGPRRDADAPERTQSSDDDSIKVVVSLVSLLLQQGGNSGLLLLSAKLHRDGRLEPELETASSPWIPSERLVSASVSSREVMVGDQSDFWKYSRERLGAEISQTEGFAEAVDLATRLFEDVARCPVEEFAAKRALPRARVEYDLCYVQELDRINAVGGLLEVYDYLGSEDPPPLVERIASGFSGQRSPETAIHPGSGLLDAALASCGSMSDGFPLTDSQRRAVHAFLGSGDGEVTAVSGPPGTGKTTMLQAIVANLMTRRALDKGAPPLIVGTSINNQAVTNIISSFASVAKDDPGSLDLRWLPEETDGQASTDRPLRSLAVYCPAKSKLREARAKYLVEQPGKDQTYKDYSGEQYLKGARGRFAASAYAYFGSMDELPRLQDWIHEALIEVDDYRTRLLQSMATHGPDAAFRALCEQVESCQHLGAIRGLDELKECRSLAELDQKLDVTLRYVEFWLAVHYFEAQWLLLDWGSSTPQESTFIDSKDRFKTTQSVMARYWSQAAALTPCFVMTAYQVPKYFRLHSKGGEPSRFDVGRIDLLIVDEAGQVDTPIGLPAFALARRALVVGDEKQLAPVWALDEQTDREVAEASGITSRQWTEDLQERGLTCSAPSSLMRSASHASRWSYGADKPGLFLSEHFRCHPGIIGFCNELLYDGLLEPSRPAKSLMLDHLTPAFLFTEVRGSEDARKGSSRCNEVEARAIAEWIVDNYAYFLSIYNGQEFDPNKRVAEDALIGVVTPFSAQAGLIYAELKDAAQRADPSRQLPERLWEKITVGTAHRLQGAERPIVLFSATYGNERPTASFIDANLELMNVAVSRAKDLFIVFAAGSRWNNGNVFEVITKYATRSDAVFSRRAESIELDCGGPARANEGELEGAVSVASEELGGPGAGSAKAQSMEDVGLAVTAGTLLKQWGAAGELSEGDQGMKAADLNVRLREAGVLEGEAGRWQPSTLAALLGVVVQTRSNSKGETYSSIEYTPRMQAILLQFYRDGTL